MPESADTPTALRALAADLDAAQEAVDRAREHLALATGAEPDWQPAEFEGTCSAACASSGAQVAEAFAELEAIQDAKRTIRA